MVMKHLSKLLDEIMLAEKKRVALKKSAAAIAEQKRLAEADYDKLKLEFESFVQENRPKLFGDGKTVKTEKADFGFKDVKKIMLQKPEQDVVAALQKRFPATWDTYTTQKIGLDKKTLGVLTEKQLEKVGIICVKEAFWLRLKF